VEWVASAVACVSFAVRLAVGEGDEEAVRPAEAVAEAEAVSLGDGLPVPADADDVPVGPVAVGVAEPAGTLGRTSSGRASLRSGLP
jgi:hypothetical protein